jgi:serine/threonine-protein phosphatase 2A regulatory subunit A
MTDRGWANEIRSEEVSVRLTFVKNLPKLAETIGPVRFRDEVLPDIKELLEDEDDILLAIAEELGKEQNINLFVGDSAHSYLLLSPLEALSKLDETLVREKAVTSLSIIGPRIPDNIFEKNFIELVQRLSESDWFSSKSSACGLFHVAYPRASPASKQKLLAEFKRCCEDHTPIVRRNAATHLKKLVVHVDKDSFPQLVEDFKTLAVDDQDSVRLLAIENCVAIAEKLSEEDKNAIVKPVVLSCGSDRSWRVRYMVANCFTQLVDALGKQITQNELVPVFVKLLKDSEAEVRTAASSKVSGVSKLLNKDTVLKDILPCVKSLAADESSAVREALAGDVMGLAPIFGKDGTNEYLLELFLQLLKDDTAEVRLNVIGKLNQVTPVFGLEQLSQHLLPAIVELAEDRQWRIRAAIQGHIPHLAEQLGMEFFNDKLCSLCVSWLNDCVFSIREASTHNLKNVTAIFGIPWAKQILLPKVADQSRHRNYLYRTVSLTMVSSLSEVFPQTDIQTDLIPFVLTLATDPISNIRINSAKTLNTIIPKLDVSFVNQTIVPFLTDTFLKDTRDRDVIFFGNVALQTAKNHH